MNPLSLHLQNYGVFRDETITLPEGLVGILGELRNSPAGADSNGAGKTTLVNALVACLFGPSGRSFADDLTRGEDRMEIELTFEQGDDVYRVRRTFTTKGGAKLDFERGASEVLGEDDAEPWPIWEPLTRESLTATQDLIDRTIGLTRKTFLDSVFLSQEDGSFADGRASEVKQLLTEAAFGLEPSWPGYADRANTERKGFEVELQQLEGRTQAARVLVAVKPTLEREYDAAVEGETVAADTVADREREHVAIAERWQAAREQDATRKACEAEVREASSAYNALAARGTAADDAARQIVAANERLSELVELADIAQLEQRITELSAAVDAYRSAEQAHAYESRGAELATKERATLLAQAAEHETSATTLRDKRSALEAHEDPTCQTCGQHLPDEAKTRALASYDAELEQLAAKSIEATRAADAVVIPSVPPAPEGTPQHAELASARTDLTAAMQARTERAMLAERIELLTPAAGAGPSPRDLAASYTAVREKEAALAALPTVDIAAIELQGGVAKRNLDEAKAGLDSARSLRARLDERRVQMTAAEQALGEAATRTTELHAAIDTRVRLEKACGLNGVPALILETSVIPFMESQAAAALAALGTPWQIEIRTQREKKDGALADACEVVVITETGESPFRKLSGGEQMRVNIALRVALSKLFPGRSRLLVIDEPRWLDAAGIEALIESLRGLLGEFSRIYVVTQSGTALRDSFDTTLTVIKDSGASRVIDGYAVETEAIAA